MQDARAKFRRSVTVGRKTNKTGRNPNEQYTKMVRHMMMLKLGADLAQEIDIQRDGESAEHGPWIRLLTPTERPHSANSASYAPDCPKDKMRVSRPSVREMV